MMAREMMNSNALHDYFSHLHGDDGNKTDGSSCRERIDGLSLGDAGLPHQSGDYAILFVPGFLYRAR